MRKFENGLEASSIAYGISTPELIVISLQGVTSFAFQKNKPVVALTEDALNVDLTVDEAGAVMAEQLAHVVIGDTVKKANPMSVSITAVLFIVLGLASGILVLATRLGGDHNNILVITYSISALISLAWLLYPSWKLEAIKYNTELLTDSIAVKVTGNPSALEKALLKLNKAGLMSKVETFSDYENALKSKVVRKSSYSIKRTKSKFSDRIENLNEIEKGSWSLFDIDRGKALTRTPSWQ